MNIIAITWPILLVSNFLKEACVESLDQAISACAKGADQLELCSHLVFEGLTPNVNLVKEILAEVNVPVKCMLRNRKGDFVFNEEDISQMLAQLKLLKKLNISGIVTGALTEVNTVDFKTTSILSKAAYPLPVTFHKCIDLVKDIPAAIDELKKINNIKFILSSGGAVNAEEGKEMLKKMIELSAPEIRIIPAGSITHQNVAALDRYLEAPIYHGKRIVDKQ